jgi:hypothetical protein
MSNGNSIINIGDISKPAVVLIEKISDALGVYFEPHRITRMARAEAQVQKIKATAQIETTELHQRALRRFLAEEAKKQDNIESITAKALPYLEEESKPQNIEDDWVTNFFDKCRLISDEQMQTLWAKVLAGEANFPGSYSKRTVNFLSSLDKKDAIHFATLCSFCWFLGDSYMVPLIYNEQESIYKEQGITFNVLEHLDDIGLVSFTPIHGYQEIELAKHNYFFYYGIPINIEFQMEEDNQLAIGKVILTQIGQELAPICGSEPIPGFLDYVLYKWSGTEVILSSPYPRN